MRNHAGLKVMNVVGARPNFMKIAPLIREMGRHEDVHQTLVHTGQHYDANLSDVFFRDLAIPKPDFNLAVGPGSRDEQILRIGDAFERVLLECRPDLVIVVGDVNSTIACGKVARWHRVKVAYRFSPPAEQIQSRNHRLRWHSGGVNVPRHPLSDDADEYRASHNVDVRYEHACRGR